MVSIIIPVFNYDCTELVKELRESCLLAQTEFEILIGNDCSTDVQVVDALKKLNELTGCRVINEEKNIGRAFILNHLAQVAQFPYLIIIDSDARVPQTNKNFIANYLQSAEDHDVVCGGIVVRKEDLKDDNQLRYRYEFAATKSREVEYRKKHPYEKLCTINLLIRRDVFNAIQFDRNCYQYGYEDTVLGIDLMKKGVSIIHTDNPLIHTGIDSNASFLNKTHMALHVLIGLDRFYQEQIRISRTAFQIEKLHMLWAIRLWHRIFHRLEFVSLLHCPSVFVFNLYKLGYFSLLMQEKEKNGCIGGCDETPKK